MIAELTHNRHIQQVRPLRLSATIDVESRAREIHELIAKRAYSIYEGRGHAGGHDVEDWLQAEAEVLVMLGIGFMEQGGDLTVDVGITPSELSELQVRLEPSRLIVSGKKTEPAVTLAHAHESRRSGPTQIFQVVKFPVVVKPSGAKATFSNGLLEFRIPKAVTAKAA
jgi:Protein of unknown function (DUF2934)